MAFIRNVVRAREILHADRSREPIPLAAFVDGDAIAVRRAGVGVFVPVRQAEVQALVVRSHQRDAVARGGRLQALRVVDVELELVAAVVDPATLHPEFHTRPRVRAHVRPGGVDRRLRRRDLDVDGHFQILDVLDVGLHRDRGEVIRIHEPLL